MIQARRPGPGSKPKPGLGTIAIGGQQPPVPGSSTTKAAHRVGMQDTASTTEADLQRRRLHHRNTCMHALPSAHPLPSAGVLVTLSGRPARAFALAGSRAWRARAGPHQPATRTLSHAVARACATVPLLAPAPGTGRGLCLLGQLSSIVACSSDRGRCADAAHPTAAPQPASFLAKLGRRPATWCGVGFRARIGQAGAVPDEVPLGGPLSRSAAGRCAAFGSSCLSCLHHAATCAARKMASSAFVVHPAATVPMQEPPEIPALGGKPHASWSRPRCLAKW